MVKRTVGSSEVCSVTQLEESIAAVKPQLSIALWEHEPKPMRDHSASSCQHLKHIDQVPAMYNVQALGTVPYQLWAWVLATLGYACH